LTNKKSKRIKSHLTKYVGDHPSGGTGGGIVKWEQKKSKNLSIKALTKEKKKPA